MRRNAIIGVTAAVACLFSAFPVSAQMAGTPYVTYEVLSSAGDYYNFLYDEKDSPTPDPNPYAMPISVSTGERLDLFVGTVDKGIEAEGSAQLSLFRDDATLSASVRSEVTASANGIYLDPHAGASAGFYEAIPLRFSTRTQDSPWSCTISFLLPNRILNANVGSEAKAIMAASFQDTYGNFYNYDEVDTLIGGEPLTVVGNPYPSSFTFSGKGNTNTLASIQYDAVVATLQNEVPPTAADAFIDPGLPLAFTNLSPGLTIMGPDGYIYATSVPEASPAITFYALLSAGAACVCLRRRGLRSQ